MRTINFIIGLFIVLTSCNNSKQKTENPEIVFLTNYFADFVKASHSDNSKSDVFYKEKIQTPIFNNYFLSSEYSFLVSSFLEAPIKNVDELQKTLDRIDAQQEVIIKNVSEALSDSRSIIKNENVTVYILPANPDIKFIAEKMGGVMGLTAGSKQLLLFIDPEIVNWEKMLKYSVAHEYHHACWIKNNFSKASSWTLIEYLIFEGRADSYAHLIYPDIVAPWTHALTESKKSELWNQIKGNLQSTDYSLQQQIMFGSSNYPYWGGYTLGYDIVQKFIKDNKDVSVDNWTNIEGKTLLERSNYE